MYMYIYLSISIYIYLCLNEKYEIAYYKYVIYLAEDW